MRRGGASPDFAGEGEARDYRQLGSHLLSVHRYIGSRPLLVIGMTAMIRLHTYSIFSGDGSLDDERGEIERPVTHTLTLLGPGRSAEDYHHVRYRVAPFWRGGCLFTDLLHRLEDAARGTTGRP